MLMNEKKRQAARFHYCLYMRNIFYLLKSQTRGIENDDKKILCVLFDVVFFSHIQFFIFTSN